MKKTPRKSEVKTNADRIRAMKDKELAEFLVNFKNTFGEEYEGEMSCLEWLKSDTKEFNEEECRSLNRIASYCDSECRFECNMKCPFEKENSSK